MWADTLSVILRTLSFIALFQAAGIAIFLSLWAAELKVTEARLRRLALLSSVSAALLLIGQYLLEAARMSGELSGVMDPVLQGVVLHSATSLALSWRLLGLLLMGIGLRLRGSGGATLGMIGVATLLTAFTFTGHTSDHAPRWLLSPLLLAHLLIIAFWFGALLPLYLISQREPAPVADRIVDAFSARAVWLVPGILLAGLALATFLLPSWGTLFTPYGELLIVKVIGFSGLMILAAFNKWRFGPALERGDVGAGRRFRRSLLAECGLITAILCVTAVLTTFYSPEG